MSAQIEAKYQELQGDLQGLLALTKRCLDKHAKDVAKDAAGVSYSHIGELGHVKEELKQLVAFLSPSGAPLETLQEIDQALEEGLQAQPRELRNSQSEGAASERSAPREGGSSSSQSQVSEEAQAALFDHLKEYGALNCEQRECTQSPWWAIVDEDRLTEMLKSDPSDVCHAVAHSVAGPYFSRALAQTYLDKLGRKFHKGAKVYCLGAMNAPEWTWFANRCKELAGIDPSTGEPFPQQPPVEESSSGRDGALIDTEETL